MSAIAYVDLSGVKLFTVPWVLLDMRRGVHVCFLLGFLVGRVGHARSVEVVTRCALRCSFASSLNPVEVLTAVIVVVVCLSCNTGVSMQVS